MPAIILNGASSSGKTSIAKAIQKLSPEPFLHISLDSVVDMFRWDAIQGDDLRGECHSVGVSNFHKILPILLSSRFPGVIDHVFERDAWYQDCLSALVSHRVLLVGVHCPLDILRSREAARGDRRIGLAEIQFPIVHKNREYDIDVDTNTKSAEDCAVDILAAYKRKVAQTRTSIQMQIRHYDSVDEPAVIALWSSCGLVVPQNNPDADIRRKLQVSPELFLVGILDSRLVASVMAGYEGHRGWINYLAVAPGVRRNGYGRALMEHAERLLRERGCPKINLQVRSTNRDVIEFYRRLGFVTDDVMSMGKRLVVDGPFS